MVTVLASGAQFAGLLASEQTPTPTSVPVHAEWPFSLQRRGMWREQGQADFQVVISSGVVTAADPVGKTESGMAHLGREALRQWRFDPSFNSTFRITLSHRAEGSAGCEQDFNQTISVSWPERVEVVSKEPLISICDPGVTITRYEKPVSVVTGTVWCDCPGSPALAGFVLEVTDLSKRGATPRRVLTDQQGRFRISSLVPGRYGIAPEFGAYSQFVVRFAPGGSPLELEIRQKPTVPVATAVVAGTIPFYPAELRAAGRQGNVDVRISLRKDEVIDIDAYSADAGLAAAAIANVRTWRFESTSVPIHTLRFSYVLERTDCRQPPLNAAVMKLPSEVTVRASVPCAGFELLRSPLTK